VAESRIGRVLHGVLIAMALVAAFGLLHAAVLSKTPPPAEWAWEEPLIDGYRCEALPGHPAATGRHYAHGPVRRFRLQPETGGSASMLTMASVHSRHHDGFHLDALLDTLPLDRVPAAEAQPLPFASQPASTARLMRQGAVLELQTCVVPGVGAGVTLEELAALVEKQRVRGWRQSLKHVLGLQSNVQWECLLLTLEQPASPSAEADITGLAHLVMENLQRGQ